MEYYFIIIMTYLSFWFECHFIHSGAWLFCEIGAATAPSVGHHYLGRLSVRVQPLYIGMKFYVHVHSIFHTVCHLYERIKNHSKDKRCSVVSLWMCAIFNIPKIIHTTGQGWPSYSFHWMSAVCKSLYGTGGQADATGTAARLFATADDDDTAVPLTKPDTFYLIIIAYTNVHAK